MPIRGSLLVGALHGEVGFRQLLFEPAANGGRLRHRGLVLCLTIGDVRGRCRQLGDVLLLGLAARRLFFGELLLQRLPPADFPGHLDVEGRLAFGRALLAGPTIGDRALFSALQCDLRFRKFLFDGASGGHRLGDARIVLRLTIAELLVLGRQL